MHLDECYRLVFCRSVQGASITKKTQSSCSEDRQQIAVSPSLARASLETRISFWRCADIHLKLILSICSFGRKPRCGPRRTVGTSHI